MPDPVAPTPTTVSPTAEVVNAEKLNEVNVGIVKYNENAGVASLITQSFSNAGKALGNTFDSLASYFRKAGVDLQNINSFVDKQPAQFAAITTAILGSRDAFKNFGDTITATNSINTFIPQLEELSANITKSGSVSSVAAGMLEKMANSLIGLGKPQSEVKSALATGATGFIDYAKQAFAAADSQLRLQHSLFTLAANTGSQKAFYEAIGDDMSRLNEVTDQQTKAMTDAAIATGIHGERLEAYSGAFYQLPGAIKAMSTGLVEGNTHTNMLAKTMQFAAGAGRDYKQVTADMQQALLSYTFNADDMAKNIDGSLQFVGKMTEIANKYGAQIEDVRKALNSSAQDFKMYVTSGEASVNMTKNLADVMNEYVGKLTNVGVPAQNAIAMYQSMNSQMNQMNVAQKAFLSGRSGGPGGLLGAVKIDQMMAKGDTKGVFDMIQKELKKEMGGKITTLGEANTEAGARQLQKEVAMLRQGPMGAQVKSDQEAYRLLESMKSGKAPTTLGGKGAFDVEAAAKAGKEREALTETPINQLNATIDEMKMSAGSVMLTTMQHAFTEKGGASGTMTRDQTDMKEGLKQFRETASRGDPSVKMQAQASQHLATQLQNFPHNMKTGLASVGEQLLPAKKESADKGPAIAAIAARKSADVQVKAAATQLQNFPHNMKTGLASVGEQLLPAKKESADKGPAIAAIAARKSADVQVKAAATQASISSKFTDLNQEYNPAGEQVADTATKSYKKGTAKKKVGEEEGGHSHGAAGGAAPLNVSVNLTSTCPHCNSTIKSSSTSQATKTQ